MILDNWCIVSGAKFNIDKTEILLIGVPSHQEAVHHHCNSAELDMTGSQVPEEIKIAADGVAVRTLGAWVGNKVKQVDIEENLRWELGHPIMEGHQLIVLMVASGMTQYLTKVQGMPPNIPARNKVITVTWLRAYLDFSSNHPTWAYVADAIIAHHTPASEENVDLMQWINIFLQSWKTSNMRLPGDLKVLIKTAQKYNVCLDGLALSQSILCEMPI
ncbi:hypothetical protein ARMGADRAFT_1048523 [Armillaria gallica]|uniref:Uncharacterized protein n=1 Tax=Armillaria gallica TaxID=47427 RepID=A0A2H3CIW4_ARMGA|nr:hypothetical protein ARMGADRAFT_1048523 [Armillaria gallica]